MPKFHISYTFHATASAEIEADSEEEAREKIDALIETDGFDLTPQSIDDVDYTLQEYHPSPRD